MTDSPGTGRADTESPTATESSTCSESPRAPPSKEPIKSNANGRYKQIRPKQTTLNSVGSGKAKERLTALMSQLQKEAGWVWAVKIWNNGPKAFYWADNEGDTLLHIAVWNQDIPKIYGIVEHMKKVLIRITWNFYLNYLNFLLRITLNCSINSFMIFYSSKLLLKLSQNFEKVYLIS